MTGLDYTYNVINVMSFKDFPQSGGFVLVSDECTPNTHSSHLWIEAYLIYLSKVKK